MRPRSPWLLPKGVLGVYILAMYYHLTNSFRQAGRMVAAFAGLWLLWMSPSMAQNQPAVDDLPLIEAARTGSIERLELAIMAGATLDQRGNVGKTALHVAVEWGRLGAVAYLIAQGAQIDKRAKDRHTALTYAVLRRREDIAATLLEAGADPDRDGYDYETPLIMAARLNNKTLLELLLAAKADPEMTDGTGRTALDWAQLGRRTDIVALLKAAPR